MEKLNKVIAGLRCCGADAYPGYCEKCPYDFEKDLSCLDTMCEDALVVIEALIAERDDLRKDVGVLSEELRNCREKLSWLEPRTAPNDWGEYPSEFPREGM